MKVNGQKLMLDKPLSLMAFLLQKGYEASRIAVEMNGAIVPKKDYETRQLHEDDTLEIVTFMGGG